MQFPTLLYTMLSWGSPLYVAIIILYFTVLPQEPNLINFCVLVTLVDTYTIACL